MNIKLIKKINYMEFEINEKSDGSIKVVLLGETFVGKTSLINVYIKNVFNPDAQNTLTSTSFQKTIETSKGKFSIKIWDTAGQERFRCLNKLYIKGSSIVIFVYDISRKSTFNELTFWINYTKEYLGNEDAVYGILGNKIDLLDKESEIKEKYPDMEFDLVSNEEGMALANKIGAEFCETSSKEGGPGLSEFIMELVKKFLSKKDSNKSEKITLKDGGKKKKKLC